MPFDYKEVAAEKGVPADLIHPFANLPVHLVGFNTRIHEPDYDRITGDPHIHRVEIHHREKLNGILPQQRSEASLVARAHAKLVNESGFLVLEFDTLEVPEAHHSEGMAMALLHPVHRVHGEQTIHELRTPPVPYTYMDEVINHPLTKFFQHEGTTRYLQKAGFVVASPHLEWEQGKSVFRLRAINSHHPLEGAPINGTARRAARLG